MWSGWALYVMLLTQDDITISYKYDQYNYKQECYTEKQDLAQQLEGDILVRKYLLLCIRNNQPYKNSQI